MEDDAWEDWVIYILDIVTESSRITLQLIEGIREQMAAFKHEIRSRHPRMYSQDLINNLFRHCYTRIDFVMGDLGVSRPTATKYLEQLVDDGLLVKISEGRNNYYVNLPLVTLLEQVS